MKIVTRNLAGAGLALALISVALSASVHAQDADDEVINAGEIIAGAVIVEGLSGGVEGETDELGGDQESRARGSAVEEGDVYGKRDGWRGGQHGGARRAVQRCIRAVEKRGTRYSRSEVTRIFRIKRTRKGYRVSGNVVVVDGWRGDPGYGRFKDDDDHNDDRSYRRGYDKGRFICRVRRGKVADIEYRGLDHWR
jgi:hypothetical protein